MSNFFKKMAEKAENFSKNQAEAKNHRFRANNDSYRRRFSLPVDTSSRIIILDNHLEAIYGFYSLTANDETNKYTPESKSKFGTRYMIPVPNTTDVNSEKTSHIISLVRSAGVQTSGPEFLMAFTALVPYKKDNEKTHYSKKLVYLRAKDMNTYGPCLTDAYKEFGTVRGLVVTVKRSDIKMSSAVGEPSVTVIKKNGNKILKPYLKYSEAEVTALVNKTQPEWFKHNDLKPFNYSEVLAPATSEEVCKFFNLIEPEVEVSDLKNLDFVLDEDSDVEIDLTEDSDDLEVDSSLAARLLGNSPDDDEDDDDDDEDNDDFEDTPKPSPKKETVKTKEKSAQPKPKAEAPKESDEDDEDWF